MEGAVIVCKGMGALNVRVRVETVPGWLDVGCTVAMGVTASTLCVLYDAARCLSLENFSGVQG